MLACIWQYEAAQAFAGVVIDALKLCGLRLQAQYQSNWYVNRSIHQYVQDRKKDPTAALKTTFFRHVLYIHTSFPEMGVQSKFQTN